METITISRARFDAPESSALLAAAQADLAQRYGGGDETPVAAAEFDPPAGAFVIAWAGQEAVGCGGWRVYRPAERIGEIKRMYTVPAWRGRGVATAVVEALEQCARTAGMARLILETGLRQPEAMALYERMGYTTIAKYGYYRDEPESICYGRDL